MKTWTFKHQITEKELAVTDCIFNYLVGSVCILNGNDKVQRKKKTDYPLKHGCFFLAPPCQWS